jgi:hypothetical protein
MNELSALGHLVAANINLGRWADAERLLRERAAGEVSELVDWETYLLAEAALLAWEKDDPALLLPPDESGKDSDDAVVSGWWLMDSAVRTALDGDIDRGALIAVQAVEQVCTIGVANEDVPLTYSLAVDVLLAAGDRATLERITAPLAALPLGPRFRLLHGQILRVQAMLSPAPAEGLRDAVAVLDAMGAAFWAARARVDLAAALADAGDMNGAAAALSAAEPLLRECGATRALRIVDELRGRDGIRQLGLPRQTEDDASVSVS